MFHCAVVVMRKNKIEGNVLGRFYVDDQCIDCDLCREICPDCFGRNEELGSSIVIKQPENQDEVVLCEKAMSNCPVNAIWDDGE
jgi:ferredoxin